MRASGGTVTAASNHNGAGVGVSDAGVGGSFTADGNAFIVASSISDNSEEKKAQWSGVIFEGTENGKVYGSPIALTTGAEIPAGKTLEIGEGEGVKLTNSGKINNQGTIDNQGTIEGNEIVAPSVHEAAGR